MKSPAEEISCVGIRGTPAGAKLPSGNVTPQKVSVGLP